MRETSASAAEQAASGEARVVERLAGRFTETGLPRMTARVFAALIVSPNGALTAADIGQFLSISSGTVSTAVQSLVRIGLITRENVPGSRRDLYRVREDPWPDVFAIRSRWLGEFAKGSMEDIEMLEESNSGAKQRLTDMREFGLFVMPKLEQIVTDWRTHRPTGEA
ncbi:MULTISPECIES: GbsR/MarR family transcriptional regulator [unclassified Streptomyces]|uniref:GbsR/MarR family transcriptional regulator n=1 Tax=unclassified Streptomyces TaxID=2593676 RepID=UPI0022B635E1|nr:MULTISPECIES: helix-turn-helix domain-containing protein [unclassified Streptomyces]MCZ7417114.1 helix-turn-helix domain-containing protein [Streptomyces sp. WMMC897]MCZ7433058.1 helix-turn-helix domain-containing protein [Streptomyces sp. WMMC1477]